MTYLKYPNHGVAMHHLAPRLGRSLAAHLALGLLSTSSLQGCVTQSKYDHARAAMQTEHQAHRATARQLLAVEREVDEQEQELSKLESRAEAADAEATDNGNVVAEGELEREHLRKDGEEQTMLVTQLREELARVGGHLRTFADEREKLQQQLLELRTSAALRAEIVRDLTFALHDSLAKNQVSIELAAGKPVVRIPSGRAFVDGQARLNPEALQVLGSLGRALAVRDEASVEISERHSKVDSDELQMQRLQIVADTLAENGIPFERVMFAMPETLDSEQPDSNLTQSTMAEVSGERSKPTAKVQIAVEITPTES